MTQYTEILRLSSQGIRCKLNRRYMRCFGAMRDIIDIWETQ